MKILFALLLILSLTACGGSSGGGAVSDDDDSTPLFADLVSSAYTNCARTNSGVFKCWGYGESYNFANGLDETISDDPEETGEGIPAAQLGDTRIVHAETNEYFGCALYVDNTVKCWGDNSYVGLDDPDSDTTDYTGDSPDELGNNLPVIDFGTDLYATQLSLGNSHACVILNNGRVKCWGDGGDGRTGYGDEEDRGDEANEMGDNLPYVDLGTDGGAEPYTAKKIAAGWDLTCAVLNNDQLKCWGENDEAQLGYGDFEDRGDEADEMGNNLPFVDLGAGRSVKDVFVYYEHACAILDNDALKCWGANDDGEIGLGTGDDVVGNTVPDTNSYCNDLTFEVLYTQNNLPGGDPNCALGGIEFQYANDYNDNDILDDPLSTRYFCHVHDADRELNVVTLNPGDGGCTDGGIELEIDFDNNDGMGDRLAEVDFGSSSPVIDVLLGDDHTCGLLRDGTLRCWGDNSDGQSGIDEIDSYGNGVGETPENRAAPDLGAGLYATSIAGSYDYSCAILNNDTIKCWGYDNDYATLGVPAYFDLGVGDGDPMDEMGEALEAVPLF